MVLAKKVYASIKSENNRYINTPMMEANGGNLSKRRYV
jgi:hypothetical protein